MLSKFIIQNKVREAWWKERSVCHQSKKTKNWIELIVHTWTSLVQDSMSCQIPHMGNKYYRTKRILLILVWRAGLVSLIFRSARLSFRAKMLRHVLYIHQKFTKPSLRTQVFRLASHHAFRVFKMNTTLNLKCHLLTLKTW
jgi:hypothetical protein